MTLDRPTLCPRSSSALCATDHTDPNLCHCSQHLQKIKAQLVEAEQRVATLKAQYTALQAAVNQAHDFVSGRLPLEISSYIFELYVDSQRWWHSGDGFDSEYSEVAARIPLRLGAVCRSWRKIAWSLPRIWTSLRVNIRSAGHQHGAELARQWLERSHPYPLSIDVRNSSMGWSTAKFLDNSCKTDALSLVEVINFFASRWQILAFDNVPSEVLSQIDWEVDPKNSSILRHLTLCACDEDYHCAVPQPIVENPSCKHHPTHITISHIDTEALDVEWTNITHFNGTDMSSEDFFDMLRRASSLTNCSLIVEGFSSEDELLLEVVLPGSVVNTTLQKLTIDSRSLNPVTLSAMLDALELPSLQELHYDGCGPSDALFPFINGPFCLQSLHLEIPGLDDGMLGEIFDSVPMLKTLSLGFDDQEDGQLFELLSMTRPGSVEPLLLPMLESLQVRTCAIIRWESVAKMYGDTQIGGSGAPQPTLRYPSQRQSLRFDLAHQPGTLTPESYIDPPSLLHFVHIIQGPGLTIRSLAENGHYINFIEKSFNFHLSRGHGGPELASCYKMIEGHPLMTQKTD